MFISVISAILGIIGFVSGVIEIIFLIKNWPIAPDADKLKKLMHINFTTLLTYTCSLLLGAITGSFMVKKLIAIIICIIVEIILEKSES